MGKYRLLPLLLALAWVPFCKNPPERQRIEIRDGLEGHETTFLEQVLRGDRAVVRRYLKAGMPASIANEAGVTALMLAAQQGDLEMVSMLINAGAQLNPEDRHSLTALDYARQEPASGIFRLLVSHGAQYGRLRNRE